MRVTISDLVLDDQCQCRADGLNRELVEEYAEALVAAASLPPPKVIAAPEGRFVVWDGFHTIAAHVLADVPTLDVDLGGPLIPLEGALDLARLLATGANATHGFRRSKADQALSVARCLELRPEWSVREVARHVGVSKSSVQRLRRSVPVGHPAKVTGAEDRARPKEPGPGVGELGPSEDLPPLEEAATLAAKIDRLLADVHNGAANLTMPDSLLQPAVAALLAELRTCRRRLRERTPHVCPACSGEKCQQCHHRGWILTRSIPGVIGALKHIGDCR